MRRIRTLLLLGIALAGLCHADRVVAIGDVHGAYDQFVSILQAAGLIDKDLAWTGGKTVFVQVGDVPDRGPRSRAAFDLLMDLVGKAARQGGEVRPLLGNHETMVMMGDLRYVSEEEYRAFAGPDSEKIREAEYENYVKYRQQRAKRLRQPSPSLGESEKQAWIGSHKPGFFEFRQAFAPNGKYGTWLRTHDAVTQVGDAVFLHGGLSPQLPQKNIKEINEKIRREIVQLDELWAKLAKKGVIWPYMNLEEARAEAKMDWNLLQQGGGGDPELQSLLQTFLNIGHLTMVSPEGPLWYRGYAQDSESELSSKLDQVLKRFKVHYMVIGHTVTPAKRITPRFDGRVFMIDTGMLVAYFQGRPSALEMNGGHFKAIYVGEEPQDLSAGGASKTH